MARVDWDRWAAGSGVVFVVLLLISSFLLTTASPPSSGDPAQQYVAFLTDHRTAYLVRGYLTGLALVFFVWFLVSWTVRMRAGGEPRLASIAYGGGLLLAGWALLAISIQTVFAWRLAGETDPGTVKAVILVPEFGFAYPLVALAAASTIAILRSRMLPTWVGLYGVVATLWFAVSGAAYAKSGFFSPDGAFSLAAFLMFLGGVLIASVYMIVQPTASRMTTA